MNRHLILFIFPFFLIGCPDSNTKKKSEIFKTVQMGNPEKLFAGADTDTDMWSQSIFKSGEKVWLNGVVSFESRGKQPSKSTDLEQEQAPDENPTDANDDSMEFLVTVDSPTSVTLANSKTLSLRFRKVSATETVIEMLQNGEIEAQSKLVHYSVDKKGRSFTLLTYETNKDKSSVSYFQFRTYPQYKIELEPNTFYKFTSGPGVYARWKKTFKLNVCGQDADYLHEEAKLAVTDWNRHLPKKIKIKLSLARRYRPFSDLNQNCMTLVDDFLTEPRSDVANFALTISVPDLRNLEIFSSNLLFFKGEFEKSGLAYNHPKLRDNFRYTVRHEIGHSLGLDHKFDKNFPSLMSYEYKAKMATPYDIAAIRELYGHH